PSAQTERRGEPGRGGICSAARPPRPPSNRQRSKLLFVLGQAGSLDVHLVTHRRPNNSPRRWRRRLVRLMLLVAVRILIILPGEELFKLLSVFLDFSSALYVLLDLFPGSGFRSNRIGAIRASQPGVSDAILVAAVIVGEQIRSVLKGPSTGWTF